MVGLPRGEKNVEAMYNRLYSIPRVTDGPDRQIDRQTDRHIATA